MEFFSIKVWDNFTIKEIHQRFFAVNFDIGVWDFTCILKSITVLFLSHFDIVMILHIKKINTLSSQSFRGVFVKLFGQKNFPRKILAV